MGGLMEKEEKHPMLLQSQSELVCATEPPDMTQINVKLCECLLNDSELEATPWSE